MLTLYAYPALFGVADNNGCGLKVLADRVSTDAFVHGAIDARISG